MIICSDTYLWLYFRIEPYYRVWCFYQTARCCHTTFATSMACHTADAYSCGHLVSSHFWLAYVNRKYKNASDNTKMQPNNFDFTTVADVLRTYNGMTLIIKPYQNKGIHLGTQTARGSFQPLVFETRLGTRRTVRTYWTQSRQSKMSWRNRQRGLTIFARSDILHCVA